MSRHFGQKKKRENYIDIAYISRYTTIYVCVLHLYRRAGEGVPRVLKYKKKKKDLDCFSAGKKARVVRRGEGQWVHGRGRVAS